MQEELTSRLSSSWMYIAYTPLLFWFMTRKIWFMSLMFVPLCWWIDKKRERNLEFLYKHVCFICYLLPLVSSLVSSASFVVSFVGIKSMFISLISNIMFMHIYIEYLLHIFIVYCYAWVKGELLWSITLIHAYITPWVLSSLKRWEIVGPKAHLSSFDDD